MILEVLVGSLWLWLASRLRLQHLPDLHFQLIDHFHSSSRTKQRNIITNNDDWWYQITRQNTKPRNSSRQRQQHRLSPSSALPRNLSSSRHSPGKRLTFAQTFDTSSLWRFKAVTRKLTDWRWRKQKSTKALTLLHSWVSLRAPTVVKKRNRTLMADELRPASRVNWSDVVDNTSVPTQKLLSTNVATIWFLDGEKPTQVTVTGTYLFQRWAFHLRWEWMFASVLCLCGGCVLYLYPLGLVDN